MGDSLANAPSFMGVPMKLVSLVTLSFSYVRRFDTLIFIKTELVQIMHYSRVMPTSSARFLASTAVFLNEVLKLSLCIVVAFRDRRKIDGSMSPLSTSLANLYSEIFRPDNWKLAIPACLYTLQNRLQYVAVSNLDAATFQVTYQLKILTTALFSVTMLRRSLNSSQWISLVFLTGGVGIVQLPTPKPAVAGTTGPDAHRRSATYEGIGEDTSPVPAMNRSVGLVAVIIACMLSGLAGVYFEKVLKGSSASLWVRNIQLSFYSLFPAFFIGVVLMDGNEIMERGFFDGYNTVVWTAIVFQALGGIVVALCVNFADNIAKNFATSISILISFVASVFFFDFKVTINFVVGALFVLFATYLYSRPDQPTPAKAEYVALEKAVVEGIDSPDSVKQTISTSER
ncbi:nucleotide-sugar transporter-domain-containing protein [Geopyxis carbonaria]|nr:nucleotide-sugar transporter-domain-containing protein [Geopyxis carbonaria]